MVDVLAFDIGGANTKAAYITSQEGTLRTTRVAMEFFPIWKAPQELPSVLLSLKHRLKVDKFDAIGVTITAELSDAYQTKREGIHHVLGCAKAAFPEAPLYVLNTDARLVSTETALAEPLGVAAANWAATGWLVAQRLKNGVVVDVGSTSTSIIPIKNGQVTAQGKTDLDKLICGELVYTGSLRTNIAAIVHSIPLKMEVAAVSSELFALSGDVHLILGNITPEQYTSETADGRDRSVFEAMARLARVVCGDTNMLSPHELTEMAQYIYSKQVEQIAAGLGKVYANLKGQINGELPVVVTGLGKNFLAKKAAESICADKIITLDELVDAQAVIATPAYGVALMVAKKLEGDNTL
ncbi:MAG: H4MPT-linked C1 transfer pathway protein [Candidatus Bathyarchaeota archaeon]|nr:H4MPT-linked C1 transfer pathway protein [Candidatus Bathyarchaeota archaeon]